MAIVSMTDAVSGQIASAAEYNKLIDNIQDLDARMGAVVSTNTTHSRLNTLETRTTDVSTGNTALGNRVTTLETMPYVVLRKNANQGIGDGPGGAWDVVLTWQTVEAGDASMKSGDTVVIPSTGAYLIAVTVNMQGGGSIVGDRIAYVTKNATTDVGANSIVAQQLPGSTSTTGLGTGLAVATIRQLAAGDVLRVMVFQNSGATLNVRPNSFGGTTFAVRKVK